MALIATLSMAGCNQPRTQVRFVLSSTQHKKFYLERLPFGDSAAILIDSGITRAHIDSFDFVLPGVPDQVYRFRVTGKGLELPFINDIKLVRVRADYASGKYSIQYSPAGMAVKSFRDRQELAGKKMEQQLAHIDTLTRQGAALDLIDSCRQAFQRMRHDQYRHIMEFCDTVSNPAAFLMVYNQLDFGKDYEGLKKYIQQAGRRFPAHSGMQQLVQRTVDFADIFLHPYRVGDTVPAPDLALPDEHGLMMPVFSSGGRYTFIDCWTTWDPSARHFSAVKKQVYAQVDGSRLSMVSIAVDGEQDAWRKIVAYERYEWPQLIDAMMWKGPTVNTFHFDTIPFNVLVDPHRKVLARSIHADSIAVTFERLGLLKKGNK